MRNKYSRFRHSYTLPAAVERLENRRLFAAAPTVAIDDVQQFEGNSGTTPFVFTVTRSGDPSVPFTVDYATADGTATLADADYVPAAGTLSFGAGDMSKTITVLVNGDTRPEGVEAFTVNLSNFQAQAGSTTGSITKAAGTGTILEDDVPPPPPPPPDHPWPELSINDVTKNEGNNGLTPFVFTVSLALTFPDEPATVVHYATASGPHAQSGVDYVPAAGTLTFPPGQASQSLTVYVRGDTRPEPDDVFYVDLSNPGDLVPVKLRGVATILNDDFPPPLVTHLNLIDARTGAHLGRIDDGATIDLSKLPAGEQGHLTIAAYTVADAAPGGIAGPPARSVSFRLDGRLTATDSSAPFALFGKRAGAYVGGSLLVGSHTLLVSAYAGPDGTGLTEPGRLFHFKVVNSGGKK